MASERKIYCHYCDTYCGTIRDASLMKGLIYTCVTCQEPTNSYSYPPEPESGGDWISHFSNILRGKKK